MNLRDLLLLCAAFLTLAAVTTSCGGRKSYATEDNIFHVEDPDTTLSPFTGMTRQHWIQAATYLLDGAFSYIHTLDDPMYFPKQLDKTYPRDSAQVPVAKLEGLCRTLFIAAPLLKENPKLKLNSIRVADYYRHQLTQLCNPESPSYIKHRGEKDGPSQTLVELGALAISLTVAPEVLWDPLTQEQKDQLAATMLSYGNGPTIDSNWRFFNIFVLSFFKEKGYPIKENVLKENLERTLAAYRAAGWYNDSPAYDYYSMWAFQMYGPLWAHYYGKFYPDYATQYLKNQDDLVDNYPYLFARDGQMNMWGRSIPYRFASVVPFSMLALCGNERPDYGWLRHISSATLLQFLQNPQFLQDRVPTMGFYGPFAPAVQIYSCRGSVYWCGKAFLALLLPEEHPFWSTKETEGPWANKLKPGRAYSKYQPISNLLITNYPNSGASEVRSWCHERVADDWQQFRSSENYNKLAYNTEFPWMADGPQGEVSMNYAVRNEKGQWEVLRLYDFQACYVRDSIHTVYARKAELESNAGMHFKLAEIPMANGILRLDMAASPFDTEIRLGHYSLPQLEAGLKESFRTVSLPDIEWMKEERAVLQKQTQATILDNGEWQLAMVPLIGWEDVHTVQADGLHPVSQHCAVTMVQTTLTGARYKPMATLMLWKRSGVPFTDKELMPIRRIEIARDIQMYNVYFQDGTEALVSYERSQMTPTPALHS